MSGAEMIEIELRAYRFRSVKTDPPMFPIRRATKFKRDGSPIWERIPEYVPPIADDVFTLLAEVRRLRANGAK